MDMSAENISEKTKCPLNHALRGHFDLLKKTILFENMTDEKIAGAIDALKGRKVLYEKDEFLHFPYTQMNSFGIVLKGAVCVCMDDMEGNRMIMSEVMPQNAFGESLCYLKITDSPMYAYALLPSEVLWLSVETLFKDTKKTEAEVVLEQRFTAMLAARCLKMNDRIQVLSKIGLRDKITTYFAQLSEKEKSQTFNIPMSRDDFAAYLGVNRSSLSRELSNMKKEKIIEYSGRSVRIL